MIIQAPFPNTDLCAEIKIVDKRLDGWSGSVDGVAGSFAWGVVTSAPWVTLLFTDGALRIETTRPTWVTELVTAYSVSETEMRYLLPTPERLLQFDSIQGMLEYVCANTAARSQFAAREVDHRAVWRYIDGARVTQVYTYSLHGRKLFSEQEECLIGWLSPRSKKTLSGADQGSRSRYRGIAEWTIERLTTFQTEEPIYELLPRLLPEFEIDESLDWLDCYELLERPFTYLDEPSARDLEMLCDTKESIEVLGENGRDVLRDVTIGIYLNAPFIISKRDGEAAQLDVFPTYADIFNAAGRSSHVASEIEQKLFGLYEAYIAESGTNDPSEL